MLQERCGHGTVSIGNKMFVISRVCTKDSEVFDSFTNKFTFLKRNPHTKNKYRYSSKFCAITVAYKIYVFQVKKKEKRRSISTFCYDVKRESWTSGDNCSLECFDYFSCAKMFEH